LTNKSDLLISQQTPTKFTGQILDLPIFIPAKQKAMVTLALPLSAIPQREPSESDAQFHERLRSYCQDHIGGQGFVLFDDFRRYQINLPGLPDAPKGP
jgi:hypothetical protein